ncbi:hypothetical protein [uncultured Clostridium sp.]|uniref:hypothetical protein n=1 Tax=uncultured Clostridium sp. TaxID=59620 RepID=UPI0025F351BE|nr:hypothetical protein [uncultured Clostridium sp.]
MNTLNNFIETLCGEFNNDEQINNEEIQGNIVHPKAKHINGICNDKIENLPDNFEGYFIIEESYYDMGKFKNILPHLFLFTTNENNQIVLTSYELPKDISKEDFRNNNSQLIMNYNDLQISEKFTPMIYTENNGVFSGESISFFTPETKFILKETIEKDTLSVSEVFYKNDKITFGFIDPIVYKKVK